MSMSQPVVDETGQTQYVNPTVPHRIFMNQVDEFNSRHIAEYITDQEYGALKLANEEGEGEEAEEEMPKPVVVRSSANKYEVIGTLRHRLGKVTEDILYTVSDNDPDVFMNEVLNCGFVVYDISKDPAEIPKALAVLTAMENEFEKVKEIGPKTFNLSDKVFIFVLISNVLTWGNSKPIDRDDPSVPFTEADYKKRKPHPNYLEQIACEREVILRGRKYKDKLKTYIICSGITYGFEEEELFFLFKLAWMNEYKLPLLMPGTNFIPLLHVQDLAKILHSLLEYLPKKPQYILAVEQTPCKLSQIVKSLSKYMGTGRVKEISKEEAFLYNDMQQHLYDIFTLNLNMEPGFIVDGLGVEFRNDLNLAENMAKIVAEFRNYRNFVPKQIFIHGPPASGKTRLAKRIAEYYGVHYISVKTMIEDTINDLTDIIDCEIAKRKSMENKAAESVVEEAGEEALDEEDVVDLDELNERIRDIQETMTNSENGKLPDEYVIRLMRSFLAKNNCQNQGYVLDGFPKNLMQTKELFGAASEDAGEEGVGEEGDEDAGQQTTSIMPMSVLSLDATDTFLCDRVMNMPEKDIQGSHYTEEHMLRRLKEFRDNNTEDNTLLNFFDENEIHPISLPIMEDPTPEMCKIFDKIKSTFGLPIGFPLTAEEQEELFLCQEEADRLKEEQRLISLELLERQALEDYQLKMEEKIQKLEELQMEEEKILTAQCEPLRSYLMQYVFPTLTEGLLEIARIKPEDPVDYLAEYLFRCNPEGKMFDPAYTRHGEIIESSMRLQYN